MRPSSHSKESNFFRLHIGFVIESFSSGGLEELVFRLAKEMNARGHLSFVFGFSEGNLRQRMENNGIQTVLLKKGEKINPSLIWSLAKEFKQKKLHVIHSHHLGPLIYSIPASLISGVPLVQTEHSSEHLRTDSEESTESIRKIFSLLSTCSRFVTTVNEELESLLLDSFHLSPDQVFVVRNGVDDRLFHGKYDKKQGLQEFQIPSDLPLFGVIARLEPEKGHMYLLDALAKMKHPARLIIVGMGSQESKLKQQAKELGIEDRVHFLGFQTQIPEIQSLLDCFVLPSLREGLPLALLEAMLSETPVIATSVGGIPKLLQESQGGILVPPCNASELARAMDLFVQDKEMSQKMVLSGKEWVLSQYSFSKMCEDYLHLYQIVAKESPSYSLKFRLEKSLNMLPNLFHKL